MEIFLGFWCGVIWLLCTSWWLAWTLNPSLFVQSQDYSKPRWWLLTIAMVVSFVLWIYGMSILPRAQRHVCHCIIQAKTTQETACPPK